MTGEKKGRISSTVLGLSTPTLEGTQPQIAPPGPGSGRGRPRRAAVSAGRQPRTSLRWPLGILGLLVIAVAWQVVGSHTNPILFATPTSVIKAFPNVASDGDLWGAYADTMEIFLATFVASTVVGVIVGILTGINEWVRYLLEPTLTALYSVPGVALIPLFVLWFGVGPLPAVALVAETVLFPVIINTQFGVTSISQQFMELAESFGANRREVLRAIVVPAIIPYVVAGIRIATPRGFVAIIAAELLITESGLGGLVYKYGNSFQTAQYFVPVILLVVTSLVFTEGVKRLEAKVAPWQVS
jgi:ABC-type nitrate/sulfonate/bicarbonate transport system permease component